MEEIEVLKEPNSTKDIRIVNKEENLEKIVYYTDDELKRFFLVIPDSAMRDKVFFLSLLGTGKRVSELLAVKKNNINFSNRTMDVVTLKKRRRRVHTIRLHRDVAYWISIYVASLSAEDLLFSFSRQYADDLCKKFALKAGLTYKRASCHNFRHTFAVRWLEQGKPIHKLRKHLDHSHISTTMVYLRIVDQDYFDTVDSLDMMGFLN